LTREANSSSGPFSVRQSDSLVDPFAVMRSRVQYIRHAINVKGLEIDEETAVRPGEFKGKYGVPVADAFIAAAACLEGSIVISDDPHFKRIAEIKTLTEEELLSRLG